MRISLNQFCPCESRKKYKKCYLKKESVVDLHKVKVDQFLEQKRVLTVEIMNFIRGEMSSSGHDHLQKVFYKRTVGGRVGKDEDAYVPVFHSALSSFWKWFARSRVILSRKGKSSVRRI